MGKLARSILPVPVQKDKRARFVPIIIKGNKMKTPNIAVEVFLSLANWFLIFIVINNLIWVGIYSYGNSVKLSQNEISSIYNNQSVTNG